MLRRFFSGRAKRTNRPTKPWRRNELRSSIDAESRSLERLEQRLTLASDTFLTINTNYGSFQVELFNTLTPQTVSNFLHYVNTGSFVDSIFHRSIPGFVLQGGGYTTSNSSFSSVSQFTAIATQGTIASEAGIPNARGTLAMALSTGPNSATSQWYINLADNTSLNGSSTGGPYTVFGKVIGDGMQIVDKLASLPTLNQGGAFANLPVDAAHGNQLAEITTIVVDAAITGMAFKDLNLNGALDAGETGAAGRTIYIDANNNGALDGGERSTVTDANGFYSFAGVTPGSYVLREVVPANHGLTITTPAGNGAVVNVASNTTTSGVNFGNVQVSTITPLPVSTSPLPSSPDGNTAYIQSLYLALLGHVADPAGLAAWKGLMSNGATREAVAQAIWSSPEHRGLEIDQYYLTYFGRQADPGGRAFWVNSFTTGYDERIIVASFLSSSEYRKLHNNDTSFLSALYYDVFNRAPDPAGLAAWLGVLQSGAQTQLQAAVAFVVADESNSRIVDGYFADFLHRSGTTDRQNYIGALDNNSMTVQGVGVAILASDEYFANVFNASVPH